MGGDQPGQEMIIPEPSHIDWSKGGIFSDDGFATITQQKRYTVANVLGRRVEFNWRFRRLKRWMEKKRADGVPSTKKFVKYYIEQEGELEFPLPEAVGGGKMWIPVDAGSKLDKLKLRAKNRANREGTPTRIVKVSTSITEMHDIIDEYECEEVKK